MIIYTFDLSMQSFFLTPCCFLNLISVCTQYYNIKKTLAKTLLLEGKPLG